MLKFGSPADTHPPPPMPFTYGVSLQPCCMLANASRRPSTWRGRDFGNIRPQIASQRQHLGVEGPSTLTIDAWLFCLCDAPPPTHTHMRPSLISFCLCVFTFACLQALPLVRLKPCTNLTPSGRSMATPWQLRCPQALQSMHGCCLCCVYPPPQNTHTHTHT